MTLVTIAHCRTHLRLPNSAEDAMLTIYLAEAFARIAAYIGRPITKVERVFRDPARTALVYGVVSRLSLPEWPVDPDTVAITDGDSAAIPAADFEVEADSGFINAAAGAAFSNGPYLVTAEVGLSASPRYAAEYEPIVNGAALDLVADKYQRRLSPGATSEATAGGLSRSWDSEDIPANIRGRLDLLKLVR